MKTRSHICVNVGVIALLAMSHAAWAQGIRIDSVSNGARNDNEVQTGDLITIRGEGFGENPDNLCVVIMDGERSIPLQAVAATDTEIIAEVGPVPPDVSMDGGEIAVALGEGNRNEARFVPVPRRCDLFRHRRQNRLARHRKTTARRREPAGRQAGVSALSCPSSNHGDLGQP